ncbi:MAG: S1/P1 nuclease, partial [Robiginitalea sp.]
HRVVGEVARMHLSKKARKAVSDLMGGETLAEVSNYGDAIKSDRAYAAFSPWHYVNFPADKTYTEVTPSPQGDVVQGIEKCIAILKDPKTPREEEVFYLKMLIHLVGDLHQPLHVGREEDRGGNDIQVRWFGRGSNLHRVWDANLIDDYGMSYTELARTLPRWSRDKIRQKQRGSVYQWVEEIQEVTNRVYDSAEAGEKLSYRYRYDWWDTVEEQLLLGGVRLAAVLNDIYG